ncbi:MAG: GIY-YIG nuclease family protein [bacterium]
MNYNVYILQDSSGKTYVGLTNNLERRIKEHNDGLSLYTKRSAGDWEIKWFCGFKEREKVVAFEKYLKTGSGIAIMKKRFI